MGWQLESWALLGGERLVCLSETCKPHQLHSSSTSLQPGDFRLCSPWTQGLGLGASGTVVGVMEELSCLCCGLRLAGARDLLRDPLLLDDIRVAEGLCDS